MKPEEFSCTVSHFRDLTPTVFEIAFALDRPLSFQPGQFISVVIPHAGPEFAGERRNLRRAYSIASPPERGKVELCVKLVEEGPGSGFLHSLKPGAEFKAFAPYGDFIYKPKEGRKACFVATGTGIAPFRSMIQSALYAAHPPSEATCLLGVRGEEELLYLDDFREVQGLRFIPALTQPPPAWQGFTGRVTEYFRGLGDDYPWGETEFYLCGNGPMIGEMKHLLHDRGVGKHSIHQEIYYK